MILRTLLLSLACSLPLCAAGEAALWRDYAAHPDTDPNIPDCSYAGYHYGEAPPPRIAGPVFDVRRYGARGDGKTDDTEAIRAALAAVGAEGGVVFFPRGRYVVSGVLFVHTDRTVLRGEDRAGSELVFTRPLRDAYADNRMPDGRSQWSWQGGLIWFTPRSKNTYLPAVATIDGVRERWLTGAELGAVLPARRGDRALTLDREPGVKPGDFVVLRLEHTADFSLLKAMCGDGDWARAYDWTQKNSAGYPKKLPGPYDWVVEVAAVEGRTVTLRQPLRLDVRPGWNPRLFRLGAVIRESGIENLTLRFARDYEWSYAANHNREPGWNGPWFDVALDCWLRDVTLIDADNGPGVAASKCVSLTGFRLEASRPEMSAHHHGTTCRAMSEDCLFADFDIGTRPWHGLNVEQFSSGNVWSHGVMAHGTFDTHRNVPFDNIRTDITLCNDGSHGGTGGPLMGARFVHWNIRVTNGRNYIVGWANALPSGAIVGLQGAAVVWNGGDARRPPPPRESGARIEATDTEPVPANLYEAERRLRLGR